MKKKNILENVDSIQNSVFIKVLVGKNLIRNGLMNILQK